MRSLAPWLSRWHCTACRVIWALVRYLLPGPWLTGTEAVGEHCVAGRGNLPKYRISSVNLNNKLSHWSRNVNLVSDWSREICIKPMGELVPQQVPLVPVLCVRRHHLPQRLEDLDAEAVLLLLQQRRGVGN